jgi:hypothetical protein
MSRNIAVAGNTEMTGPGTAGAKGMVMRRIALFLAFAAAACATDAVPDEADSSGDGKADGAGSGSSALIGSWISNEAPTNGDIHTFSVYMRGFISKKPAYELSTQLDSGDHLVSSSDWGYLIFHPEGPVFYFDSKSGGTPPTPRAYQVSGSGDARTLILQSDTDYREYHLDLGQKCGGSLPKCIDHFSCKAGWCVADRDF